MHRFVKLKKLSRHKYNRLILFSNFIFVEEISLIKSIQRKNKRRESKKATISVEKQWNLK
jgi:hypothetical protein